jgi:cysteine synthase A
LAQLTGRKYGGSTGTNFVGVLELAAEMLAKGESGSIVTLACDPGERYLDTYYNANWLRSNGHDIELAMERMRTFLNGGAYEPIQ